ncbi:S1 RNA-binding domain-containing protein [Candidatus Woesearchaeota archaeon]|nr:S1 RNA-binding domain-containing protein [Candidatus Woesearchaeota archaeon]
MRELLLKREGFPDEDEIVLCTVTKVQKHSVFCVLEEYGKKTGLIHISEVSPGRIRNIRDYVEEGKVVVCKVLKVDETRGYIDLSLRRVSQNQARIKKEQIKQEQKAEKIIENIAKKLKKEVKGVYSAVAKVLLKNYDYIHEGFNDYVKNNIDLKKILPEKISGPLSEEVKSKIKPKKIIIKGEFKLSSYEKKGVDIIKQALVMLEKKGISVKYKGGGSYAVAIEGENVKEIDNTLQDSVAEVIDFMGSNKGEGSFRKIAIEK